MENLAGGLADDAVDGRFFSGFPFIPFQPFHSPGPALALVGRLVDAPPNLCPSTWNTGSSTFSHGGISLGSTPVLDRDIVGRIGSPTWLISLFGGPEARL
jgi:hypothetical protein